MTEPILVWRYEDAPEYYRDLANRGGDEDWIAVIPANYPNDYIGWAESGTSFGCCSVDEIALPDGRKLLVGTHA